MSECARLLAKRTIDQPRWVESSGVECRFVMVLEHFPFDEEMFDSRAVSLMVNLLHLPFSREAIFKL